MSNQYFIHNWTDIGAKFLCECGKRNIWIHGEYDIASKEWVPLVSKYRRISYQEAFTNDNYDRLANSDLNKKINKDEFERILTIIKNYKD